MNEALRWVLNIAYYTNDFITITKVDITTARRSDINIKIDNLVAG